MMIAPIVAFQRCSDVYVTEDVTRIAEAPPEKRLPPWAAAWSSWQSTAARMVLLSLCFLLRSQWSKLVQS